jgi:ion channel-forming bestrophin family protein
MINYNPKEWFTFIFRLHKSDTVRQLTPMMISLSIYVALVAFLEIEILQLGENSHLKNITILHGMLGFVISLLLVFRTNTAYERWWEGRRMWGSLTNNTRNLAMKINALLSKKDKENRDFFRDMIVEYTFALKRHLRGHQNDSDVFTSTIIVSHDIHKPNHIAKLIFARLNRLYEHKEISGTQLLILNEEFKTLTEVCGACERIKNTPIPFSYSVFIKKFIFFYVMSLPFGYVFSLGYIAVPIVVFVFYVLASLELIAEEIENPFGVDDNDLPLTLMSKNIQKHIGEIIE